MMVAPPLLWLGAPLFPLLRGLPQSLRVFWAAPFLRSVSLRRASARSDASGRGIAPLRRRDLAVARSGHLRSRPALERLALPATRLFPRHGPAVLVSGRPPVSRPAALVAVAALSLSAPGRRAEHCSVGVVDVLEPRPVSVLCGGPAPGRTLRAGGPIGGRRRHVGARFASCFCCRCSGLDFICCMAPERAKNEVAAFEGAAASASRLSRPATRYGVWVRCPADAARGSIPALAIRSLRDASCRCCFWRGC